MGGTIPAANHRRADYHPRMPDLLLVLIVILILVLLWRGPKTLPSLGNALGRGVREAREEASKAQAEIQARASVDTKPPSDTDPPDAA
jgi:Sec-independent protein translocase protein TatA